MLKQIASHAVAALVGACCCFICGCSIAHFHAEASITVDELLVALPDFDNDLDPLESP